MEKEEPVREYKVGAETVFIWEEKLWRWRTLIKLLVKKSSKTFDK